MSLSEFECTQTSILSQMFAMPYVIKNVPKNGHTSKMGMENITLLRKKGLQKYAYKEEILSGIYHLSGTFGSNFHIAI